MADAKASTTSLTHPDADQPLDVDAELVDAFIHGGWTPATDSNPTTKK